MFRESFTELKTPEAKRIARSIAEEAWASKMLTVSDPVLRRLGSMLVLQELKERMGMVRVDIEERRPYARKVARVQETNLVHEPSDEAPDTLRSPPPRFDDVPCSGVELTCKGCELTKPEEDFYRATSSRTGRQALCRPCFNARYHKRAASSRA